MFGALRRLWAVLRQPSSKYSLLALLVVGAIGGVVFWGTFNTVLEATNTMPFCTSSPTMSANRARAVSASLSSLP